MDTSLYKFQFALKLCEEHSQKELIAYCKTCEKKICSSCIKEDHQKHDWEMLTDILREKKRMLPEECKEIRAKQLPDLKREIERFNRNMQNEDANLKRNKSVLNSSRQRYIDQINKQFDDRIIDFQQRHDATITKYKEKRDALEQKVEYLEMMTTSLDKDINTLPDHDILDMEKEMRDELEKALLYSADEYTCKTVFVPGQMDVQALENMLGEILSVSVQEVYDIDRYSDIISSMNPVSDTKAWIRQNEDRYAKLIDRNGQVQRTIKQPCYDLTIMNAGEFVLNDEEEGIISVLTKVENVIRTIDTKPLHPTHISKTENNDLLVTLIDGDDQYNLVPTGRHIVQRISLTGKVLQTYEFREDGKTRLFTVPFRTAENKNTDICVVNRLSTNRGGLVVLHKNGGLKFTYRLDGLENEKFNLVDVECDDKCRILLTDAKSRTIQILSAEGIYLCTLCQYQKLHPYVISFFADSLWCGFHEGRVKVLKYASK